LDPLGRDELLRTIGTRSPVGVAQQAGALADLLKEHGMFAPGDQETLDGLLAEIAEQGPQVPDFDALAAKAAELAAHVEEHGTLPRDKDLGDFLTEQANSVAPEVKDVDGIIGALLGEGGGLAAATEATPEAGFVDGLRARLARTMDESRSPEVEDMDGPSEGRRARKSVPKMSSPSNDGGGLDPHAAERTPNEPGTLALIPAQRGPSDDGLAFG
jgi:hypothetical protein